MLCYPLELQLNTVNFKRIELCNEEDSKNKKENVKNVRTSQTSTLFI